MRELSPSEREGLHRLSAAQAVEQALAVHSRGVDRADLNLLASAYHADATVDYGFFAGPARQFAEILSAAQRAGGITLHRTCNTWVAVAGESARSESYVIAYAGTPEPDGPLQRLIGGRYLDSHACRDGDWRLTHRTYVLDWNINRPGAAAWADPPVDLLLSVPRGGHGAADAGHALLTFGAARIASQGEPSMNTISQEAIDRALSRQALHELMMAYARGVDRSDEELLRSIFHDDAVVVTGVVNGSGAEFARQVTAHVRANLVRCFHSIANEWYQVAGDRAVGECYAIATSTEGGQDTITGGRYVDEFERRDGAWKILSHTFVCDYTITLPASHQTDGMYAALGTRGCYGRDDPVYRFWKA